MLPYKVGFLNITHLYRSMCSNFNAEVISLHNLAILVAITISIQCMRLKDYVSMDIDKFEKIRFQFAFSMILILYRWKSFNKRRK